MNGPYYSFNGSLKPISEAKIPVDDISFTYGFGVYETLKVRKGLLFFPERHEERLFHSAEILELKHPWQRGDFQNFVQALVKADNILDANIKAFLMGGVSVKDARLYIVCLNPLFPERKDYKHGATASLYIGERFKPQAKSLNMLMSYLAYREAKEAGAYDALLVDRYGNITEGTRTNFYVTDGEKILTPPAETVLEGVTKLTITESLKNAGIDVIEKIIPQTSLKLYTGAFLSSTSTKIMPLRRVGDLDLSIDSLIFRCMKIYDEYLETYMKSLL